MSTKKKLKLREVPISKLVPSAGNARKHPPEQLEALAGSLKRFGWTRPVVIGKDGRILAGHGIVLAAQLAGIKSAPCVERGDLSAAEARAYVIADNKLAERSSWDEQILVSELKDLEKLGMSFAELGFTDADLDGLFGRNELGTGGGESGAAIKEGLRLADQFLVPPFSVLDARQGYWQERKRRWLALGIESEIGRGENLLHMSDQVRRAQAGQDYAEEGAEMASGTSVFDPVLCEIAYRWWSPPGGLILDPFAGGSVRGIVAGAVDRDYLGIDLSLQQVKANEAQAKKILKKGKGERIPRWLAGDAAQLAKLAKGEKADMIFSCPPYFDLERYSKDPRDLSNMPWKKFREIYCAIVAAACAQLEQHRFACFVVGEVRDKKSGIYRNFLGLTIEAFEKAGLSYYNEAILVTSTGSLALRAGRIFKGARKLGKAHQQVLVFVKGDPQKASQACGPAAFGNGQEQVFGEELKLGDEGGIKL